ncbi:hypothetical protein EIP91_006057 [Steccherinum ochraceum]|uniref:BSD domain-containing protein n=1 Tax=Steccherinum ochraceum TaxID=92696 RepID=A0A4R0RL58_9APHY|nr:hypothetical protein EIP91_006057 [Steccherinum ochraceum]
MNFLDAYDIATPPTTTPPPTGSGSAPLQDSQPSAQSLNEEVTQVVGQLSRFWGGFRKQSQSVFEAAKKDLGEAYTQAQKEIIKLTAEPEPSTSSAAGTSGASSSADSGVTHKEGPASTTDRPDGEEEEEEDEDEGGDDEEEEDITTASDKSKPNTQSTKDNPETTPSTSTSTASGHARTTSQNFFARLQALQANLPANITSTVQNVQNQLPEALKQGGSVDLAQLRTTLTTEFQRVQGITRAQAEEYVHKSEGLLKEAQEFFKDAVKVVPPDEAEGRSEGVAPAGMLWDGSDFWMLPDVGGSSSLEKGKEKDDDDVGPSTGAEGLRAVATRAESLLRQLKHNPEVIKVDPMADERAKALYEQWIRDKVDSEEGGIGGEHWSEATEKALDDSIDGSALKATHDALVPEHISSEEFWTRYFFRAHQVEQDEQRRKAIIQGTMSEEEDFSWEDDEDEATSPTTAKPPASADGAAHSLRASIDTLQAPRTTGRDSSEQSSPRTSDAEFSRRQSSEASYDVVSSQVSASGDSPAPPAKKGAQGEEAADDEEEDSDWE